MYVCTVISQLEAVYYIYLYYICTADTVRPLHICVWESVRECVCGMSFLPAVKLCELLCGSSINHFQFLCPRYD